ncbi:mannose-6-phosphate isomerase, class I [Brevibacillus ginsengisoli]|uniref:mannose-6-phosphate isomerase, class I n=1 Tax=Brevibacillus ginsengisoli TaxID=363854 RepID=UPI003CEA2AED
MKREPIFFSPVFQERIWGGTALYDCFGYTIPSDRTGECWAISAHPNGQSVVREGKYQGVTLGELWSQHHELFGKAKGEVFPLLTKILDANTDLSVQVHPADEYAKLNENGELGKTECWYIIDCKEGAELIYGHTANSKEQFERMIEQGEWNQLLRKVSIKPGDFFFVPSGTIHALGAGTLVLETQQSSDTTYRVFDYDRIDDKGNKRELHLQKALDVTTIPHTDPITEPQTVQLSGLCMTTYVHSEYFTVQKWQLDGEATVGQDQDYLLASVLDGAGQITVEGISYPIKKGEHFLLPHGVGAILLQGTAELIVSYVE